MYIADMPIRIRLKEVMDAQGIRAAQLARDTGITEAAISEWRRRKVKRISLKTLDTLCTALHCAPGDLLDRVAEPAPDLYPATAPTVLLVAEA